MNKHISRLTYYILRITKNIVSTFKEWVSWFKQQPRNKQIILVCVGVLATIIVGKLLLGKSSPVSESVALDRSVVVASVSSLSNLENDLPLIGTVTSLSEATLRSESGGHLTHVYKKLGDTVYAGGIIAEFDNSGERASLLQAEGAYEQAKAARDIARLNSGQSGSSFIDTKSQAMNTISSAYITMDDAIHGKTDSAYSDPSFDQVRLLLSVPDVILVSSLESKRKIIEQLLKNREFKNKSLSQSSDLVTELSILKDEVTILKNYLDELFNAYNKALPSGSVTQASLDLGKANTQLARQAVTSILTQITAAKTSLTSSETAAQVAGNSRELGGGALASADAQVKQALGSYNGALSRLEKTIIRSPITGTLNSLSISTGDYVGSFTQVAVISNNGALEVLSYVTEDDAKRITIGSTVMIDGNIDGVVTRIASALDPSTKKIEVRIGIKNASSSLINGQSVRVLITKNKQDVTSKNIQSPQVIVIPISALKLTPYGASVFTVTSSSTLHAIPVKEGAILGEQIQILSGLDGNEFIVVDARGLKDGLKVTQDIISH